LGGATLDKAQSKQRPYRFFIGVFILIARVGHFFMTEGSITDRLGFWSLNNAEALGYDLAAVGTLILAAWLMISGVRPGSSKPTPETK
jgi:hypothetical protein